MSGQNFDSGKYLVTQKEIKKKKRLQSLFHLFIRAVVTSTFLSVYWIKNALRIHINTFQDNSAHSPR